MYKENKIRLQKPIKFILSELPFLNIMKFRRFKAH